MKSLIRDLCRTTKFVRLHVDEALGEAGGSFASFAILDAIALEEGLSQRDIGRRLSIEGPSITRQLDHMEAEHLVERRRDPQDRRIIRLALTSLGRQHYDAWLPIVRRIEQEIFGELTPDERSALSHLFEIRRAQLEGVREDRKK